MIIGYQLRIYMVGVSGRYHYQTHDISISRKLLSTVVASMCADK